MSDAVTTPQEVAPAHRQSSFLTLALGSVGGVPASVGVVEGNAIPYKPEAAAKKKENGEKWLDRDPEVRCYMPGIPRAMYMPYPFQITQGTNKIQMAFEINAAQRVIHLDQVAPPPNDTWMGHSVGRWEGNTLVTTVDHFNDRTWFSRAGDFHSDALKVTERFTPITPDAIRYSATIEDPDTFTRPFSSSISSTVPLKLVNGPSATRTCSPISKMIEGLGRSAPS